MALKNEHLDPIALSLERKTFRLAAVDTQSHVYCGAPFFLEQFRAAKNKVKTKQKSLDHSWAAASSRSYVEVALVLAQRCQEQGLGPFTGCCLCFLSCDCFYTTLSLSATAGSQDSSSDNCPSFNHHE